MNLPIRALRNKARSFNNAGLRELMGAFTPWLDMADAFGQPERDRLFSPSITGWLFLGQVLSADGSCRQAVRKFLAWLAWAEGKEASPNSAAYCKARGRLSLEAIQGAHRDLTARIEQAPPAQRRWYGRRVTVVDGTGLSMPDTAENQRHYPQSKGVKPGCGFPEMRVAALFSLATGVLLHCAHAHRKVHERTLLRRLWDHLEPGDVLLADRGFCAFADYHFLLERGIDSVMRLHQRRTVGLRILKRLGPGDTLVQWDKMKPAPKWLTQQQWAAVPTTLTVRHITVTVDIPGFRSKSITIATTLLDHRKYPAHAFAGLYRQRWMAELCFRDIKISLGMDILRCKTPEMIHKELAMHIIAYNLIRATMLDAALQSGQVPEGISFKGTVQTLRQWMPIIALAPPGQQGQLQDAMIAAIARDPIPNRPNRCEPRARKRRPKNYQLLTKPRHEFKENPHRNRYTKP